ncbi:protein CLN8-like [Aplysia californica]|uniref:Protein CLN8-like n=1 Tax=Aplysia californica TaxID=6500 RepID=A0ABM0K8K8_APLCA|nr:protein CLN8-like [Aplysia californica]
MAAPVQRPPPAVDVIESEEIVQWLSPALLTIDYSTRTVKSTVVLAAFLSFSALFFLSLLVLNVFPSFRALHRKHRVFMSLAICRGVFGFSCILLGSYAIFKSTNLDRDVVFGRNVTSAMSMYFTVGFFIFELAAVVISDVCFKTFSKMLITHHGLALLGYGLAVQLEANYSFGCKALILEMSTPFSCLCFVLLKAGKENSVLWKVNQMVLVHSFHLRSVAECHLWYVTYQNWAYIQDFMPAPIFVLLYFNLVLVTFVMTPYWGYKKTQQLFNPVDWNFQENKHNTLSNGTFKKQV